MPEPKPDELKFVANDPYTHVELAYALVRIKANAPDQFMKFVEAFDNILKHHAVGLMDAPPHEVMTIYNQGRAKSVKILSDVIDNCRHIVETYEAKQEAMNGARARTGT